MLCHNPPMKLAIVLTILLVALFSCMDVTWTVARDGGERFTTLGVRRGAFVYIGGESKDAPPFLKMESLNGSRWDASMHGPQISPSFEGGRIMGSSGVGISVIVAIPLLAAVIVGCGQLLRRKAPKVA